MNKLSAHGTMASSCARFFALGVLTAALGPALPDLAARSGGDLASVGAVITALFLGALVSLLGAGPLNDRLGPRPVLLVPPGQSVDASVADLLSRVAPDRKKAGLNPADTGPFEGKAGQQPENFRWEIESARGYAPR